MKKLACLALAGSLITGAAVAEEASDVPRKQWDYQPISMLVTATDSGGETRVIFEAPPFANIMQNFNLLFGVGEALINGEIVDITHTGNSTSDAGDDVSWEIGTTMIPALVPCEHDQCRKDEILLLVIEGAVAAQNAKNGTSVAATYLIDPTTRPPTFEIDWELNAPKKTYAWKVNHKIRDTRMVTDRVIFKRSNRVLVRFGIPSPARGVLAGLFMPVSDRR